MTAPLLDVREVEVRFGGVEALRKLSLEVYPGELLAVVGENGAGKSTLLNVCTGYVRPHRGRVFFEGREVTGRPPRVITRAGIARTFQHPQLFASYTVLDNLRLAVAAGRSFWRFDGLEGGGRDAEARALADLFGLAALGDQPVDQISWGARKLVDIAMGVALGPKLLLMDEPTSGVSSREKFSIMDTLVGALRARQTTGVFVEHDMEVVARYADRVAVVSEGSVVAQGTPRAVLGDAAGAEVGPRGAGHASD
jgi:branched-chain amino acid transport system ATP-binding protein